MLMNTARGRTAVANTQEQYLFARRAMERSSLGKQLVGIDNESSLPFLGFLLDLGECHCTGTVVDEHKSIADSA